MALKIKIKNLLLLIIGFSFIYNFEVPNELKDICPKGCKKYYYCNKQLKKCEFKGFFPIYPLELFELIILLISSSLSTSCGIGGGTIYSSILLGVEEFDPSEAFPVSNLLILLCGIITYISFSIDKYNHPNTKFVNYEMAMVFGTSMLVGTKFGAILNKILSNLLLLIFLNILLCFTCYKTYKNIQKVKAKEAREELLKENNDKMNNLIELIDKNKDTINKNKSKENDNFNINNSLEHNMNNPLDDDPESHQDIVDLSLILNNSFISIARNSINRNSAIKSEANEEEQLLDEENNPLNWPCIYFLLLMEGLVVVDQLLEGSEKVPSLLGFKKCSNGFWFIFIVYILIASYFIKHAIQKVKEKSEKKKRILHGFRTEISENLEKYPIRVSLIGVFAGIVSCSCGIGGGTITNPVFIGMGMDPKESSSTSNFLIIVSCLASSFIFILAGQLKIGYGLILGGLCLSASFVGNYFILGYINKTGKTSVLLVIMEYFLLFSWVIALYKLFTVDTHGIGLIKALFIIKDYCNN
jgi:uncharacterized membrane protein YfcA